MFILNNRLFFYSHSLFMMLIRTVWFYLHPSFMMLIRAVWFYLHPSFIMLIRAVQFQKFYFRFGFLWKENNVGSVGFRFSLFLMSLDFWLLANFKFNGGKWLFHVYIFMVEKVLFLQSLIESLVFCKILKWRTYLTLTQLKGLRLQ